jgi:hypothetical protein
MRDAILNALEDKYNRQYSSYSDPEKEEEYQHIRTIIWTILIKKLWKLMHNLLVHK